MLNVHPDFVFLIFVRLSKDYAMFVSCYMDYNYNDCSLWYMKLQFTFERLCKATGNPLSGISGIPRNCYVLNSRREFPGIS